LKRFVLRVQALGFVGFVGFLLAMAILIVASTALWSDRSEVRERATLANENLRVTLQSDIARALHLYDLALLGAAEAIRTPGFQRAGPAMRKQLLFSRIDTLEYLGSMLVLDPQGNLVSNSLGVDTLDVNLADRDYFYVHRNRPDAGLYLSRPFESRWRQGDISVALSRRLFNPDGSFSGVVVAVLRLQYFRDTFERLSLGQGSALTVLRDDGVLMFRRPAVPHDIGRDLHNSPSIQRMQRERTGHFVAVTTVDRVERYLSFGMIEGAPILLSVGLSTRDILAPWEHKTIIMGPITVVLCTVLIILSFLFEQALRRRRTAEAELAMLASTDALTGLPNRRSFDAAYTREWARAQRHQTSLGVLFIDADRFKAYNDRYGHGAGDILLRQIADTIRRGLQRPGDLGARYGGEEFVVILPETDAMGTCATGERLRRAVAAMGVTHEAMPSGVATVSVGAVAMIPNATIDATHLLHAADLALYKAKHRGRNRVESEE
jgi:diguanylate cyclase (GGDEF)-like protein